MQYLKSSALLIGGAGLFGGSAYIAQRRANGRSDAGDYMAGAGMAAGAALMGWGGVSLRGALRESAEAAKTAAPKMSKAEEYLAANPERGPGVISRVRGAMHRMRHGDPVAMSHLSDGDLERMAVKIDPVARDRESYRRNSTPAQDLMIHGRAI